MQTNSIWKTLIIGVLIVAAVFYFFIPKRRKKHYRRHAASIHRRKYRRGTTAQRRAAFVPKSRGKRAGKSRKMIRFHGRLLTPKQWGAAMQRARRRA